MYLDPDVRIEPLVDRWTAWPHLLCPAQQAMNLANRYLPVMRSFVASPQVHEAAARDPKMFGGPFLDFSTSWTDAIKSQIARTLNDRAAAIEFAEELCEFDRSLQTTAIGYSLDELRSGLPETLAGRVELVYDLNNHPKIRILEEMFRVDDLGHSAAQEVLLHRCPESRRPFFLASLRLKPEDDGLVLSGPFRRPAIRRLCEARTSPTDVAQLAADLGVEERALAPFFVEKRRKPAAPRYMGEGVRVRYFGHACLLIETAALAILVDPTFARDCDPSLQHLSIDDLPDHIDLLLLSHGHQDHLSPEFLMELRHRVGVAYVPPHHRGDPADPSPKQMLRQLGFERVEVLEPMEPLRVEGGRILPLPFSGEHCDLDVHSKQCFLIELNGRRICLFVDSDAIDLDVYRRLVDWIAAPDVVFMGMECFGAPLSWYYGPLFSRPNTKRNDDSRRLSGANCRCAWELTDSLRPKAAYVYAMGQEPWMRHLMGLNYSTDSVQLQESSRFVEQCRAAGIESDRLYGHMEIYL